MFCNMPFLHFWRSSLPFLAISPENKITVLIQANEVTFYTKFNLNFELKLAGKITQRILLRCWQFETVTFRSNKTYFKSVLLSCHWPPTFWRNHSYRSIAAIMYNIQYSAYAHDIHLWMYNTLPVLFFT